jgi:hypothetical protein
MRDLVIREPLISYGVKPTDRVKLAKWNARDDLRTFTVNKPQKTCGAFTVRPLTWKTKNGYTYLDGVGYCKSAQSCPWCSPRKLAEKRQTVVAKAVNTIDRGGAIIYAVFTVAHIPQQHLGTRFKNLLTVVSSFRRKVKRLELQYGINRSTRAVEETFSQGTGWHPHVNWLWYVNAELPPTLLRKFTKEATALWVESAKACGFARTSTKAQSAKTICDAEGARRTAQYSVKHSYYPTAKPTPDTDGKYRGLNAWDVLELARRTGEFSWIILYNEFEMAIKRKRRVHHYSNR